MIALLLGHISLTFYIISIICALLVATALVPWLNVWIPVFLSAGAIFNLLKSQYTDAMVVFSSPAKESPPTRGHLRLIRTPPQPQTGRPTSEAAEEKRVAS